MILQVGIDPAEFQALFFKFRFIILPYEEWVNDRYPGFRRLGPIRFGSIR